MVKCSDGRKHVIVHGYQKKAGKKKISKYERSCPSRKSQPRSERYVCCICGEESSRNDIYEVNIKRELKSICKECADAIHGLI